MRGKETEICGDFLQYIDYLAVQDEKDITLVLQSIKKAYPEKEEEEKSSIFEMGGDIKSKIRAIIDLYPSIKILFKKKQHGGSLT